jgi:hypothetical protein
MKLIISILTILVFSCSNSNTEAPIINKPSATATSNANNAAIATKKTELATVSFMINGVAANTKMGSVNDNSEQIGLLQLDNNYFSLNLNGDAVQFPHRGALTIGVEGFKMEASTYTCTASFSRYTSANAGGETQYDAQKGGSFTLQINTITKVTEDNPTGELYIASGTFSGTLGLKTGFQNDVKTMTITDGKFDKVFVQAMGKRK